MTIVCRICRYEIRSAKPAAKAEDVLATLIKHLGVSHHEHAEELALAQMRFIGLVGSFLAFGYAEIPSSESALLASYHETKQEIENILQSEPEIEMAAAPIPSDRPVQ